MKKLIRKGSQVSKDFNETLRTVVNITSNIETNLSGTENIETHNLSSLDNPVSSLRNNNSIQSRSSKKSQLTGIRKTQNEDINDWKSLNSYNLLDSPISENYENCNLTNVSKEEIERTKENGEQAMKENKSNSNDKTSNNNLNILGIFSPVKEIPFESTLVENLSFSMRIIRKDNEHILVTVYGHYTIKKVKEKIAKKTSLSTAQIALIYKNTRLESHITLSWYNINSKSRIYLKTLKKKEITGKFLNVSYPILIYSSENIAEIKALFAQKLQIDPHLIELKYKEIFLHDNKEAFLYDLREGCGIDIIKTKMNNLNESATIISYEKSVGFEISQMFQIMTNDLQCNCEEKRREIMSVVIITKNQKYLQILNEFNNLHHKSCKKSGTPQKREKTKPINDNVVDRIRKASFENNIKATINIIQEEKKVIIEQADLEYLLHVKNFKAFKHFLKEKIGTKCSLKSVSLLYHYAQSLVRFINSKEENSPMVNTVLERITRYFLKYFEKSIIAKGGMAELTLEGFNAAD